jgi:cytoskeleton protein RodZ
MNQKNGNEAAVPTLGARLRQGREAMGLSLEEAGRKLRIPHQVVRRIENDDFAALGAPVFVRGYLRSYAHLVGMPESEVEGVYEPIDEIPPLVATGMVPASRRLIERYARGSRYAVLTAITVVPILVLALGGHLGGETRMEPLDTPLSMNGSSSAASEPAHEAADTLVFQGPPLRQGGYDTDRVTVVASLLPAARAPTRAPDPSQDAPALLALRLSERSWVEVNVDGGERLEYGMLSAGSERSYPSGADLVVNIGNAEGARVYVNGEAVDLGAVRRANVARFRVSSDGAVLPLSGG